MHDVQDLIPELERCTACRWWRFTFRRSGRISRKERDELKAYGQERGLRVFDDPKRLERDFPEIMPKVRERVGFAEDDLLMLASWGRRAERAASGRDGLPGLRTTAFASRRRSITTGTSCWIRSDSSSCGCTDFPMFEWDEEDKRWVAAHHPFTSVLR